MIGDSEACEEARVARARLLLGSRDCQLRLLGIGSEGVVLTDGVTTFKVFDGWVDDYPGILPQLVGRFSDCVHIFDIKRVTKVEGTWIIEYPFLESKEYLGGASEQLMELMVELWMSGVSHWDIKPSNLRLIDEQVVLVDYGRDIKPITPVNFLFMCQRAFLCVSNPSKKEFKGLARAAFRGENIPEMDGFHDFFNSVGSRLSSVADIGDIPELQIPDDDEIERWLRSKNGPSMEVLDGHKAMNGIRSIQRRAWTDGKVVSKLEFSPFRSTVAGIPHAKYALADMLPGSNLKGEIALLIKTCYQDGPHLDWMVRHIVSQCEGPDLFSEKIVILDPREDGFLRQYGPADKRKTYDTLEQLIRDEVIDRYLVSPCNPSEASEINQRWFGIQCGNTHSVKGVPVTPQIFGFENVDSEFILQVDSDAIIVRRDRNHSYLKDMVSSLESRPNAISISFNIAHEEGSPAKEYDSPGDGGFVPEVRFCLIHRNRLMEQLPLPNSVEDGMLQMTWYRSLHRAQKERGLVSLRGGDPRSFYIHPPNERKTKIGEWKEIVSRAEAGFVPRVQYESVDLEGQIEEWKGPKRKEEYVFIICGRNAGPGKFERCWTSLLQQNFERWGAIIIDDSSDDGTGDYIRGALEGRKRNTTLIVNRERRGVLANINNAIRGYCVNPDSVIIILDMDDMLLGPNALRVIHNHFMRGADMTVGTYWRSGKGIPDFKADFHNLSPPRCGDVWMHPRAFRKYLFDAVPEDRMKHNGEWIDKFTELTYMVPIAQMSQRPRQIHVPLYFWEPHHPRNMDHYRRNQETIGYVASYEPLPKLERESLVLPAGELCNKEFHEPSVIFLRHAEKMVPQDRGSDHADVPLTEQGKEDSRVFGGQIRGKIGQIISSPTLRTMQTAESIREGNRSDCPITVLSDFRTSGCKNRSLWDIKKKELGWSRLIRSWIDGDLPLDIVESHLEFALNLLSLVSANMGKNEDAHCVVVTHDHVITALSGFFNDPAFRVGYLSGFARSKESVARLLEEDRMERNGLQS